MTTARQTPGDPAELDALVALAQREHRAGRLAEAAAAYRKILALRPDIAEVAQQPGQRALGPGQARRSGGPIRAGGGSQARASSRHTTTWATSSGSRASSTRPWHGFEQALALAPDLAEAHNNLGNVLKDQGKLDEAAAQFEQAVALKPDLAEAHNNLGNILREQGKLDQALARFEQALALKPDLAEAHNNLGNALKQQGKFDEALAQLRPGVWPSGPTTPKRITIAPI